MSNYAAEVMSILIMTIIRTLGQAFAFWVVLPAWAIAYEVVKKE